MRVVTAREMHDIDAAAIQKFKIPSIVLMENAGHRAADIAVAKHNEFAWNTEILIFAGKGNNGGDALVTARQLIAMGKRVRLFLLHGIDAYRNDARINLEILLAQKVRPIILENVGPLEEYFASAAGPFLVVDGLLGIGFKGPLSGLYADVVDLLNAKSSYTIALDIPTGIDATTGASVGQAVRADLTIAFGFPKLGHYIYPGALNCGELRIVDIALPIHFRNDGYMHKLVLEDVAPLIRRRDRFGHKNSFGHTLVIGGSTGKLGSVAMAARASLRVGAGLVTAATWEDCYETFASRLEDEIMSMSLSFEEARYQRYKQDVHLYSAVVVGPGMGTGENAKRILADLIDFYRGPLVIDADGINLLADTVLRRKLLSRKDPTVLTPHPGEMARMLGVEKQTVVDNPIRTVSQAAEETNAVVLLKGATTFIAPGDGHVFINHYPNDGMATAGSGDVLAGIIGGLAGQKIDSREAVCAGVFLHSLSGEIAGSRLGHRAMTASDIISHLGDAFLKMREYRESLFEQA